MNLDNSAEKPFGMSTKDPSLFDDDHRKDLLSLKLKFYAKFSILDKTHSELDDLDAIEELQEVLSQAEEFNIQGKEITKVNKAIEEMKKFQQEAKSNIEGVADVVNLKRLHKQAKKFGLNFKESIEIKKKYKRYLDIKHMLQKGCKMTVLRDALEEFRQSFKDDEYLTILREKWERAKDIEKEAQDLLKQEMFTKEDICIKSMQIIRNMELSKVEFPEKEDLLNLKRSYDWLRKLHKFIVDIKNSPNNMKEEKSEKSSKEESIEMNYSNVQIDDMVQLCSSYDAEKIKDQNESIYLEYKRIIEEGRIIDHKDKRIDQIFTNHSKSIFVLDIKKEISDGFDEEEVSSPSSDVGIDDKGEEVGVVLSDHEDINVKQENQTQQLNIWKEKFRTFIASEAFESILKEEQDPDVNQHMNELMDEYRNNNLDSEIEYKILVTAWRWYQWAGKAIQAKEMIRARNKLVYEELQAVLSTAVTLEIPQDCSLYHDLETKLLEQTPIWEAYLNFKQRRGEAKALLNDLMYISDPKERKKKCDEIASIKPELDKIIELEDKLTDSIFYVYPNELEDIKRDIKACESYSVRVQKFIRSYEPKIQRASDLAKITQTLTKEIEVLYEDAVDLVLRDKECERELKEFDLAFRKNQLSAVSSLSKKVEELTSQEIVLKEYRGSRENLRGLRMKLLSEKAVVKLLEDLKACKADNENERKIVEDFLERGRKMQKVFKKLKEGSEKVSLQKITTILEHFYKLPIKYSEEKLLEWTLRESKKFESWVKDEWSKYSSLPKVDCKWAERVYTEYKDQKIVVTEAENVCKLYLEAKKNIEEFKIDIDGREIFSFDDLLKLMKQAQNIRVDQEKTLEQIKRRLWISAIGYIKDWKDNKNVPEFPIIFNALKSLLLEGYELLTTTEAIHELREDLRFMEVLMSEVEQKIVEIAHIEDQAAQEKMGYKLFGFIDLREELIDYKAQASIMPNFNPNERSVVRHWSNKKDEEIIEQIEKSNQEITAKEAEEIVAQQTSENSRLGKRKSPEKSKNFDDENKHEKITKMVEKEDHSYTKKDAEYTFHIKDRTVTNEMRQKAHKKLADPLKENPHFSRVQDLEHEAKQIEINIFSEFSEKPDEYERRVRRISDFLYNTRNFKNISEKLVKTRFKYAEINNIRHSNIEETEKKLTPTDLEIDLRNKILQASNLEVIIQEPAPKKQSYESIITSLLVPDEKTNRFEEEEKSIIKKITTNIDDPVVIDEDDDYYPISKKKKIIDKFNYYDDNQQKEKGYDHIKVLGPIEGKPFLKIFEGDFEDKPEKRKRRETLKCSLYTCESVRKIESFPRIPERISVQGKVLIRDASVHIEKLRLKAQLLPGWISTEPKYHKCFKDIAEKLNKAYRYAIADQGDFGMYLIAPSSVDFSLAQKFNWGTKYTQENQQLEPLLFFLIYEKKGKKTKAHKNQSQESSKKMTKAMRKKKNREIKLLASRQAKIHARETMQHEKPKHVGPMDYNSLKQNARAELERKEKEKSQIMESKPITFQPTQNSRAMQSSQFPSNFGPMHLQNQYQPPIYVPPMNSTLHINQTYNMYGHGKGGMDQNYSNNMQGSNRMNYW